MSSNPLLAMGNALYALLAFDATLLALAPGGAHTDLPNNVTPFPMVWIELQQDQSYDGFGSQPGRKNKPGINLCVHVYQSDGQSLSDSQRAMARVIDLLWNDAAPLTVDGYEVYFGKPLPDAKSFQFADQELRGQKVKEAVLMADYILEKAA